MEYSTPSKWCCWGLVNSMPLARTFVWRSDKNVHSQPSLFSCPAKTKSNVFCWFLKTRSNLFWSPRYLWYGIQKKWKCGNTLFVIIIFIPSTCCMFSLDHFVAQVLSFSFTPECNYSQVLCEWQVSPMFWSGENVCAMVFRLLFRVIADVTRPSLKIWI